MKDLVWREYRLKLSLRTQIMGIINLTPDSFSGDGLYNIKHPLFAKVSEGRQKTKIKSKPRVTIADEATRVARKMVEDGADIIDLGGESTRPGTKPVSVKEEIKRVIPVITRLAKCIKVPISIDTYKSEVAKAALDAGASMVNSIKGIKRNIKLARLISRYGVPLIIMHIKGTPCTMQKNPRYESVIAEIISDLKQQIALARDAGIDGDKIIIDPGIGFGKTTLHNILILKNLRRFRSLGKPIAIGTSRKSFIGNILSVGVEQRLMGTAATVSLAVANGAHMIRVHDVREMAQVARVTDAVINSNAKLEINFN